nr:MAG TPA: hypothetical protein [Caudoviricetes sp.]
MKWFLIEFWHFVTTSNILGVVFGFALAALWKRIGKIEAYHVKETNFYSEEELLRAEKEVNNSFLVNVFNSKGVDVFIERIQLIRGDKAFKARRVTSLDVIKIEAISAKTLFLSCEVPPQEGDLVKLKFHKVKEPIVFKIK